MSVCSDSEAGTLAPFLSTVFWLNAGFGLLCMLAVMAIAPWVAAFYREPILAPVLTVLSISFPVTGLVVLQRALLEKAMTFDVLAKIETVSTALGGALAVLIALAGGGVWSLILQSVMTALSMAVLVWMNSEWRPGLALRMAEIRSIAAFSANLTGFNIFNYFARNADYILIGRLRTGIRLLHPGLSDPDVPPAESQRRRCACDVSCFFPDSGRG